MKEVSVHSKIETFENPRGLQAVSFGNDFCIATPHKEIGKLLVTWIQRTEPTDTSDNNCQAGYKTMESVVVSAH